MEAITATDSLRIVEEDFDSPEIWNQTSDTWMTHWYKVC